MISKKEKVEEEKINLEKKEKNIVNPLFIGIIIKEDFKNRRIVL